MGMFVVTDATVPAFWLAVRVWEGGAMRAGAADFTSEKSTTCDATGNNGMLRAEAWRSNERHKQALKGPAAA